MEDHFRATCMLDSMGSGASDARAALEERVGNQNLWFATAAADKAGVLPKQYLKVMRRLARLSQPTTPGREPDSEWEWGAARPGAIRKAMAAARPQAEPRPPVAFPTQQRGFNTRGEALSLIHI